MNDDSNLDSICWRGMKAVPLRLNLNPLPMNGVATNNESLHRAAAYFRPKVCWFGRLKLMPFGFVHERQGPKNDRIR